MSSKIEDILKALLTQCAKNMPHGVKVLRNSVLPERIPREGIVILRDGQPNEPFVLMSPLSYSYEHNAEIDIIADGPRKDDIFDALKVAIHNAIDVDKTLSGLCDYISFEAPIPATIAVDGGESMKAATIPIILHYQTSSPLL